MPTPDAKLPPPTVLSRAVVPESSRYTGPLEFAPPPSRHRKAGRNWAVLAGVLVVLLLGGVALVVSLHSGSGKGATAGAGDTAYAAPPTPIPADPSASSASAAPTPSGSSSSAAVKQDSTPASGTKMPVGDIPGWTQVFTDDFSGNSLSDKWFTYDGQPQSDPAGYFSSSHVSVGGGNLTIAGYKDETPAGQLWTTGGVSNHNSFTQSYGRFDVRFRMDKGVGIAYALLLWPSSNNWPPEIDILEDNGHDRTNTSATLHYGAHDTKIQRFLTGNNFTVWHTATLEWTPGKLVYLLDGKQWATISSSNVPSEPMDLALQTQAWGCGGSWEACPNSTTPSRVNLQVDWVVAYSWNGA